MKLRSLCAVFFAFTFLFSACDKKKEDPTPTPEPAPAVASNSMTAKVNNADWAAFMPTATIQNGELILGGANINRQAIALYTQNAKISAPGTYSAVGSFVEISQDTTNGPTWVSPACSVTITKLDTIAKKMSGTFLLMPLQFPEPALRA